MDKAEKRRRTAILVTDFRRRIKEKAVSYKGGQCQKCGYDKCVAALSFHHRDPKEKEFRLSSGRTKNWEKVKKELDKCDLLCANCHMEVHDQWKREAREQHEAEIVSRRRRPKTSRVHKAPVIRPWPESDELRHLVETTPITHIAKMVGVSDKAVLKRCKKLDIATHPAGFWARKKAA